MVLYFLSDSRLVTKDSVPDISFNSNSISIKIIVVVMEQFTFHFHLFSGDLSLYFTEQFRTTKLTEIADSQCQHFLLYLPIIFYFSSQEKYISLFPKLIIMMECHNEKNNIAKNQNPVFIILK